MELNEPGDLGKLYEENPKEFMRAMKIACWLMKGMDEHGFEVAYHDDEVIMLRMKKEK